MMKKLINKKETFLTDMLEGLLIAHPELDLIANTVIVCSVSRGFEKFLK